MKSTFSFLLWITLLKLALCVLAEKTNAEVYNGDLASVSKIPIQSSNDVSISSLLNPNELEQLKSRFEEFSSLENVKLREDDLLKENTNRNAREIGEEACTLNIKTVETSIDDNANREVRSCRKHNLSKANIADSGFNERPKPLRGSMHRINTKLIKSQSDSKLMDDLNESEGSGCKKKKKLNKNNCHLKNLHMLQPLKKGSIESPKRNENELSTEDKTSNVVKATMGKNNNVDEVSYDANDVDEDEVEEQSEPQIDEDDSEGRKSIDKEDEEVLPIIKNEKPLRKAKFSRKNKGMTSLTGRVATLNKIGTAPLVGETNSKHVFGGKKKLVTALCSDSDESRNYNVESTRNRKQMYKQEGKKIVDDHPEYLAGVKVVKLFSGKISHKNEDYVEDDENVEEDVADRSDSKQAEDAEQSVVGIPSNTDQLKLKDLQNVSEVTNSSIVNRSMGKNYGRFDNVKQQGMANDDVDSEDEENDSEEGNGAMKKEKEEREMRDNNEQVSSEDNVNLNKEEETNDLEEKNKFESVLDLGTQVIDDVFGLKEDKE